jgi:hypothetical protein
MPQWLRSAFRFITAKPQRREVISNEDKYKYLCQQENVSLGFRNGQSLMVALYGLDRKLYRQIVDSKADCFFDDTKIPAFYALVKKKWGIA